MTPILAALPLLAVAAAATDAPAEGARPGWQQALLVLAAAAAVVLAGRYVVRPVLRRVAQTELRELFTAFALFLVVGIALLMQKVGLSPALGTFPRRGGARRQRVPPRARVGHRAVQGPAAGLFFISVGADINFGLMVKSPLLIAGLVFGTMAVKFGVLMALGPLFGLDRSSRWLLALSLCQIGEFAFVLFSFGAQTGVIPEGVGAPLVQRCAAPCCSPRWCSCCSSGWCCPGWPRRPPARARHHRARRRPGGLRRLRRWGRWSAGCCA
ncbi:MAG: cation:proton antiporter [Archangiaceae bacterium]|nr:cation:proton antiporter [Archangiaceae bacterium]